MECNAGVNGSSHDSLSDHIRCKNIFIVTTQEDKSPRRSKICAMAERMSRLVTVSLKGSGELENPNSSEVANKSSPSNLLGSLEPTSK